MERARADFYGQSAITLAPALIGAYLCRAEGGRVARLRITETECYCGEEDTACHAHRGKTPRNAMLYLPGGHAYVYLCYGIHNLLNIVSGPEGHPEAVLLRGVEGFAGPGRLTKHLHIDRGLNGENLIDSSALWIELSGERALCEALPRVGISYAAEPYLSIPWRYRIKEGPA